MMNNPLNNKNKLIVCSGGLGKRVAQYLDMRDFDLLELKNLENPKHKKYKLIIHFMDFFVPSVFEKGVSLFENSLNILSAQVPRGFIISQVIGEQKICFSCFSNRWNANCYDWVYSNDAGMQIDKLVKNGINIFNNSYSQSIVNLIAKKIDKRIANHKVIDSTLYVDCITNNSFEAEALGLDNCCSCYSEDKFSRYNTKEIEKIL